VRDRANNKSKDISVARNFRFLFLPNLVGES